MAAWTSTSPPPVSGRLQGWPGEQPAAGAAATPVLCRTCSLPSLHHQSACLVILPCRPGRVLVQFAAHPWPAAHHRRADSGRRAALQAQVRSAAGAYAGAHTHCCCPVLHARRPAACSAPRPAVRPPWICCAAEQLTAADLYAGIGNVSLGLELAGFKVRSPAGRQAPPTAWRRLKSGAPCPAQHPPQVVLGVEMDAAAYSAYLVNFEAATAALPRALSLQQVHLWHARRSRQGRGGLARLTLCSRGAVRGGGRRAFPRRHGRR